MSDKSLKERECIILRRRGCLSSLIMMITMQVTNCFKQRRQ